MAIRITALICLPVALQWSCRACFCSGVVLNLISSVNPWVGLPRLVIGRSLRGQVRPCLRIGTG